jgi:hypothetical protein
MQNISYTARSVSEVEIFHTQTPSLPYDEIGILTYRAGTAEKYTQVASHFRDKAAQVGADGVIMMGTSTGPGIPVGSVIVNMTDYRGIAIRYK